MGQRAILRAKHACVRCTTPASPRVWAGPLLQLQTNMMVRPYGQYSFLDYTKFGALLQVGATLISVGMTMALIP